MLQGTDRTLGLGRGREQAETDQGKEDYRFCVHTKVYAGPGESVGGGGLGTITRNVAEELT